jgi:hypothetical protein
MSCIRRMIYVTSLKNDHYKNKNRCTVTQVNEKYVFTINSISNLSNRIIKIRLKTAHEVIVKYVYYV